MNYLTEEMLVNMADGVELPLKYIILICWITYVAAESTTTALIPPVVTGADDVPLLTFTKFANTLTFTVSMIRVKVYDTDVEAAGRGTFVTSNKKFPIVAPGCVCMIELFVEVAKLNESVGGVPVVIDALWRILSDTLDSDIVSLNVFVPDNVTALEYISRTFPERSYRFLEASSTCAAFT